MSDKVEEAFVFGNAHISSLIEKFDTPAELISALAGAMIGSTRSIVATIYLYSDEDDLTEKLNTMKDKWTESFDKAVLQVVTDKDGTGRAVRGAMRE